MSEKIVFAAGITGQSNLPNRSRRYAVEDRLLHTAYCIPPAALSDIATYNL